MALVDDSLLRWFASFELEAASSELRAASSELRAASLELLATSRELRAMSNQLLSLPVAEPLPSYSVEAAQAVLDGWDSPAARADRAAAWARAAGAQKSGPATGRAGPDDQTGQAPGPLPRST